MFSRVVTSQLLSSPGSVLESDYVTELVTQVVDPIVNMAQVIPCSVHKVVLVQVMY